jgi:hypothetical protein
MVWLWYREQRMLRTVDFRYIVCVVNGETWRSCEKYCLRARHNGHLPHNKRQGIMTWSLCCKWLCTGDKFDQRICVCVCVYVWTPDAVNEAMHPNVLVFATWRIFWLFAFPWILVIERTMFNIIIFSLSLINVSKGCGLQFNYAVTSGLKSREERMPAERAKYCIFTKWLWNQLTCPEENLQFLRL